MEERRKFVRLDTRLGVVYQVLPSTTPRPSRTKDLAGGGICVFVSELLKPGTALHVDVTLPNRDRPVPFQGEVVWCEEYEVIGKTKRERSVEAGVKFVTIDPRDRQAILEHVILSLQPHQPV